MTNNKRRLRQLIEAVEGDNNPEFDWGHCIQALGNKAYLSKLCVCSYHGSLDAAKSMHEALLPGWDYGVRSDGLVFFAWVTSPDYEVSSWRAGGQDTHDVVSGSRESGVAGTPARAWLIAILKAYESQTS